MKDRLLKERCLRLKLILTDVDGVMTDGAIFVLPNGDEARVFNVRDGYGVILAHAAGLETGIITGRASNTVIERAKALGMSVVKQGSMDKTRAFEEILAERKLEPHEVAYIGDDFPDLPVLQKAGLSATPADAPIAIKNSVYMVLQNPGGRGALREFIDAILQARGAMGSTLRSLGIEPPPDAFDED
jgi:3-deoxy-D-manno-octulosonate 8-phosphate phosphatase (KDO 8-P phosphatase)